MVATTYVIFLALTSWICHLCKPPKRSTHTLAVRHVSICGVASSSSSSSYATCFGACICHIACEGQVERTTPREGEENEFVFHSVTCYTNSIVSDIHVNTTKLRNITCTLVAICVMLRNSKCILRKGVTMNPMSERHLLFSGQERYGVCQDYLFHHNMWWELKELERVCSLKTPTTLDLSLILQRLGCTHFICEVEAMEIVMVHVRQQMETFVSQHTCIDLVFTILQ